MANCPNCGEPASSNTCLNCGIDFNRFSLIKSYEYGKWYPVYEPPEEQGDSCNIQVLIQDINDSNKFKIEIIEAENIQNILNKICE